VATSGHQYDENWLQKLLFGHPDLLPIADIDPGFGKLIPLVRELPVTSGYIDVLYATADGSLCLVETKLWRNPEAHRTVLAQLLDYAKALSQMDFTEFRARVEAAAPQSGQPANLDEMIKRSLDGRDHNSIDFEANIRRALATGEFLLLIVGDRIRPEVMLLSDILGSAPSLEFSLHLVEMNFYHLNGNEDWPVLAVPSVVGRSHEVTRAVVRIRYEKEQPKLDVTAIDKATEKTGRTTAEIFLKSMPSGLEEVFRHYVERWMNGIYTLNWGKVGFSLRYAPKDKLMTLFDAYPTYVGIITEKWEARIQLPPVAYRTYRESLAEIPVVQRAFSRGRQYVDYSDLPPEEVRQILEATDRLAEAWVKSSRT
jgi:hypothetical protein